MQEMPREWAHVGWGPWSAGRSCSFSAYLAEEVLCWVSQGQSVPGKGTGWHCTALQGVSVDGVGRRQAYGMVHVRGDGRRH